MMHLKFHLANLLVILPIIILLSSIWLQKGLVIGYSESGTAYGNNYEKLLEYSKYTWQEFGTGWSILMILPTLPSQFILTYSLSWINDSSVKQNAVFLIMLISSALSMYLLTNKIYDGKNKRLVLVVSSLFYVFNTYSMIMVWNRKISLFLMTPLIPLITLLTLKLFETKNYKYAFYMSLTLSIFSVYYIITTAMPFYLIFAILLYKVYFENYSKKDAIRLFAVFLLFFGLTNLWYLFPIVKNLFEVSHRTYATTLGSAGIFKFPLSEVLRLFIPTFDFSSNFGYYNQPAILLISYSILFIMLYSFKDIKTTGMYWFITAISFMMTTLVTSKINFLFEFLIKILPFLNLMMNSLTGEKMGMILMMTYAVTFSVGISELYSKLKGNFKFLIVLLLFFLYFFVLVKPMWDRNVFSNPFITSGYLKLPSYYNDTLQLMKQFDVNDRMMFLPLQQVDGYQLILENGNVYSGAILEAEIFNNPPLFSKTTNQKYLTDFLQYFDYNDIMVEFMQTLGIKVAIVRSDVNTTSSRTIEPEIPLGILNKSSKVEFLDKFGKFDIYKIKDTVPRVYSLKNMLIIESKDDVNDILNKGFFDPLVEGYITSEEANTTNLSSLNITKYYTKEYTKLSPLKYEIEVPAYGNYSVTGLRTKPDLDLLIMNWSTAYYGFNAYTTISAINDNILRVYSEPNIFLNEGVSLNVVYLSNGTVNLHIIMNCNEEKILLEDVDVLWQKTIELQHYSGCTLTKLEFAVEPKSDIELVRVGLRNSTQYEEFSYTTLSENIVLELDEEIINMTASGVIQENKKNPAVSFQKLSPVEYKVNLSSTKEPQVLVLSNTYDKDWELKVNGKKSDFKHFLINGYANAWLIDKEVTGDVTLRYRKQDEFEFSATITLLSMLIIPIMLWRMKKNDE